MGDADGGDREKAPETGPRTGAETDAEREPAPLRCDFCGEPAASVRRIALDADYDRLRTRHTPRYACPRCSERKERERLAGR